MDSFANDYSEKYKAIGSNILMVRKDRGISQTELVNRVGSNKSAISRYENGTQKPSLDTLMRMADALSVDVVDFMKEKTAPPLENMVNGVDRIQEFNINLAEMNPVARQSFTRSVRAMYKGYQKEQLKQSLGKNNGDTEHDTKTVLDAENKLKSWLENTPLYLQLQWFDTVERVEISNKLKSKRWITEITSRDSLYLKKLGVNIHC